MGHMIGFVLAAAALLSAFAGPAAAQTYPNRPIRLIAPYPPGGGADLHARLLGQRLSPLLGQPIVVENRAGASGNIGSDYVAKSAPDGYTLLVASSNLPIAAAFGIKLPFDILTDFAPITTSQASQQLLVVRPTLPVNSVKELIAYAKANPGKLSFGSSGVGMPLLSVELLKMLAGLEIVHIPYKGDAPALTDLLGGQIDIYAANAGAVAQHYRSGKMRGLAVSSRKRAAALPEVPTMEEAGIAGYNLESWMGFVAPANTPQPIIERLNSAFVKVLAMPEVEQQLRESGAIPMPSTPEEFTRLMRENLATFTRIVKSGGLKAE